MFLCVLFHEETCQEVINGGKKKLDTFYCKTQTRSKEETAYVTVRLAVQFHGRS